MKSSDITFSERQKFKLILIVIPLILFIGALIFRFTAGWSQIEYSDAWKDFIKDNHYNGSGLEIAGWVLGLFLLCSQYFVTLTTIVDKDGIYVKLFPFHFKYKFFSWDNISSIYIRKYNPLIEFGGWGIRHRLKWRWKKIIFSKANAYSISGNTGMQIHFTDGGNLLIGTHLPEELAETLIKLGKLSTQD
jgi:hypothetical protein